MNLFFLKAIAEKNPAIARFLEIFFVGLIGISILYILRQVGIDEILIDELLSTGIIENEETVSFITGITDINPNTFITLLITALLAYSGKKSRLKNKNDGKY